jgi:hypothetical protein
MKFDRLAAIAAAMAYTCATALAQTAPAAPVAAVAPDSGKPAESGKQPSLHIRCDGRPPQMSGGESFARFMGAVTLLGLFAPRPEAPDASKRLTGADGIAACSELIDGPHKDNNQLRRLQLILARAIHRMEVKDYAGAIADVDRARAEATDMKLVGNPYFDQSFGLSFDVLGAQATYAAGDAAAARAIGLRTAARDHFGYFPMISGLSFLTAVPAGSPQEDSAMTARDKVMPARGPVHAARLEELGRFAEAARLRDALTTLNADFNSEVHLAWLQSNAALSWAMAGDWKRADDLATAARAEIDKDDISGKPDPSRTGVLEVLDLYAIVKTAHDGHVDEARRNFAARSEWTAPSFGVVVATNRLLRAGAAPDQLTGALAKTPEDLWKAREARARAVFLKSVDDGKGEYFGIFPFAQINEYEKASHEVWRGDESGVIGDKPVKNSKFFALNPRELEPIHRVVCPDALLLDAAVIAKARGFKGFVYIGSTTAGAMSYVEFGNPGDADMPEPLFIDADAVIAELRQLIPSPTELTAREKAAKS